MSEIQKWVDLWLYKHTIESRALETGVLDQS